MPQCIQRDLKWKHLKKRIDQKLCIGHVSTIFLKYSIYLIIKFLSFPSYRSVSLTLSCIPCGKRGPTSSILMLRISLIPWKTIVIGINRRSLCHPPKKCQWPTRTMLQPPRRAAQVAFSLATILLKKEIVWSCKAAVPPNRAKSVGHHLKNPWRSEEEKICKTTRVVWFCSPRVTALFNFSLILLPSQRLHIRLSVLENLLYLQSSSIDFFIASLLIFLFLLRSSTLSSISLRLSFYVFLISYLVSVYFLLSCSFWSLCNLLHSRIRGSPVDDTDHPPCPAQEPCGDHLRVSPTSLDLFFYFEIILLHCV